MGLIRFLLAIDIILSHYPNQFGSQFLPAPESALQAFFVLSGFYLAMIFPGDYATKWDFYKSRYVRMYPMYIIGFFLTMFSGFPESFFRDLSNLSLPNSVFMFFTSFTIFFQDFVMFLGVDQYWPSFVANYKVASPQAFSYLLMPQGWSLGIELSFCMLLPFVARKFRTLFTLMALSFALKVFILTVIGWNEDPWAYRFMPGELGLFILGMFSYYGMERFMPKLRPQLIKQIGIASLSLVVLIIVLPPAYTYFPGVSHVFYFLIALVMPFIFLLTKRNRFDNFLAGISYPMFCVHLWSVNHVLPRFDAALGSPKAVGIIIGSTTIVGIILYFLVEKPVTRFRRRFKTKRPTEVGLS